MKLNAYFLVACICSFLHLLLLLLSFYFIFLKNLLLSAYFACRMYAECVVKCVTTSWRGLTTEFLTWWPVLFLLPHIYNLEKNKKPQDTNNSLLNS